MQMLCSKNNFEKKILNVFLQNNSKNSYVHIHVPIHIAIGKFFHIFHNVSSVNVSIIASFGWQTFDALPPPTGLEFVHASMLQVCQKLIEKDIFENIIEKDVMLHLRYMNCSQALRYSFFSSRSPNGPRTSQPGDKTGGDSQELCHADSSIRGLLCGIGQPFPSSDFTFLTAL